MARFCSNCGAQVNDDAPFCPNCGAKQAVPQQAAPQVAPQAAPQQVPYQQIPQQPAPQKQPVDLSFLKKAITNPLFILGAIICGIVAFFIKLTPTLGMEGGSHATLFFLARNDFIDKTALYVFMMIFLIIMVCTTGWLAFKHFIKRSVTIVDMCIAFLGFFLMFLITVIAFPVLGGALDPTKSYPNVGGWILIISEVAGMFFTAFPAIKGIVKKN